MDQTAVAEKALPGFPRSETMKKDIEHLILKSSEEESYDYFCETVVSFLQDRLSSVCDPFVRNTSTREIQAQKLWVFFHEERNKPGGILAAEWTKMLLNFSGGSRGRSQGATDPPFQSIALVQLLASRFL